MGSRSYFPELVSDSLTWEIHKTFFTGQALARLLKKVTRLLAKSLLLKFCCLLSTMWLGTHALIRSSGYKMSWMAALALPYRKRGLRKTGSLSGGKALYTSNHRGFSFNTPARIRSRVLKEGKITKVSQLQQSKPLSQSSHSLGHQWDHGVHKTEPEGGQSGVFPTHR